jgi:hypothetical protein
MPTWAPPPLPSSPLLLTLPQAVLRVPVLHRPSRIVKSPYLTDVELPNGSLAVAHAPSMGVGGMVVPGRAVFVAEHVPKEPKVPMSVRGLVHGLAASVPCA